MVNLRVAHVIILVTSRPGTSGDTFKNSFMPMTLRDWNLLPHEVINKTEASENLAKTFAEIVKGGARF